MSMGVQIHLDMEARLFHLLCQTAQAACRFELEINQEEMHTYKKGGPVCNDVVCDECWDPYKHKTHDFK